MYVVLYYDKEGASHPPPQMHHVSPSACTTEFIMHFSLSFHQHPLPPPEENCLCLCKVSVSIQILNIVYSCHVLWVHFCGTMKIILIFIFHVRVYMVVDTYCTCRLSVVCTCDFTPTIHSKGCWWLSWLAQTVRLGNML